MSAWSALTIRRLAQLGAAAANGTKSFPSRPKRLARSGEPCVFVFVGLVARIKHFLALHNSLMVEILPSPESSMLAPLREVMRTFC